jgi:hypothetical protein
MGISVARRVCAWRRPADAADAADGRRIVEVSSEGLDLFPQFNAFLDDEAQPHSLHLDLGE